MDDHVQQGISVKLFVGYRLTSEIKMHLKQSRIWQRINSKAEKDADDLVEIHHQDHDYIGLYSTKEDLDLAEIRNLDELIRSRLQKYCPHLPVEKANTSIFPQLFIS